jgi:tRNA1Val (adenine37-N6)-methyltransferase
MKVGTDGVLLGAWVLVHQARQILDIGTGTGLIALMMAQKSDDATIDAIEIDENAALQATENFQMSDWSKRLHSIQTSIQSFSTSTSKKYDLIVSNPPYFMGAHPAPIEARNVARHMDEHLSIEELVDCVKTLLADGGRFCTILPQVEGARFLLYAKQNGLYPSRITRVITKTGKTEKRLLMEFSRTEKKTLEDDIILQDESGQYTTEYRELTTEFYPGM